MKRSIFAAAAFLGGAAAAFAAAPAPLTSLRAIHALSNAEASHALPVEFEASVIYFRGYEHTMFVEDGEFAIYVQAPTLEIFVPGDRVLIHGITQPSFKPFILSSDIRFLRHGEVPAPQFATFDELIRAQHDCALVTVRARVRTADLITSNNVVSTMLQMNTEGGEINAAIDSNDPNPLRGLLDADVEVTGAVAGRFDGKMQQTGILLHVTSLKNVAVLRRPGDSPWSIPATPMDQILTTYHVNDLSQRVRVRGTITYYQPGSTLILQEGDRSLLIMTDTQAPLLIGNKAEAIGFPAVRDGFLTLTGAEIHEISDYRPIHPQHEEWKLLASSKHIFDLVSIDATVVATVRRAAQDEYVLSSDGELFSAIYRHPIEPIHTPANERSPARLEGSCHRHLHAGAIQSV